MQFPFTVTSRLIRRLVVAATALVAGCSNAVNTREAAELENMWRNNVIPKTTASALVNAFAHRCIGSISNLAKLPERLRADDYVQIRAADGFRAFVTDSKQPFVAFRSRDEADHCYVLAEARTGQRAAVERFMAERYPGARSVDPAGAGLPADRAWLIKDRPATMVYTLFSGATFHEPRLALGLIRL